MFNDQIACLILGSAVPAGAIVVVVLLLFFLLTFVVFFVFFSPYNT